MRSLKVFVFLLLVDLSAFGQQITYKDITPNFPTGMLAASMSIGSDGALWMFLQPSTSRNGTGYIYRSSDGVSTATNAGYANGLIINKAGIASSNSTYSSFTVPSPQGAKGLFGYPSIATQKFVVLQANNGVANNYCLDYTVDGGKSSVPQYLLRGPFPAYDGTYSLASTTIKNTGTSTSPNYTLSSTLFELGAVTNAATSTCALKTILTVDKEIVQAVKQPGGKYLVNQVVLPGSSWQTRVGLLGTDGSYTDLVSNTSQFHTARCCYMAQDYGTASAVTSNAVVTYFGADGNGHALSYINGVFTEVFNSSVAGHLTADICVDAFHAGVTILSGSDSDVASAGQDKVMAVNVTSDTHQSSLVASTSSFLLGTIGYKFVEGLGTLDDSGVLYFQAYNQSTTTGNVTDYFFQASVPGITQAPVPVVDRFDTTATVINAGDTTTMTWATRNATTVSILGLGPNGGVGIVPVSGSMPISPAQTTTYFLTATGPNGIAKAQLTVTVNQPVIVITPQIAVNGIRNAASFDPSLSPGSFGSIFGQNLANASASASVPYPTSLSVVQVLVNGSPVPVQFVSTGQINFLVPFNTALGNATFQVVLNGVAGNSQTVPITATSPGLFQYTVQGVSFGIATDSNNNLITADNPYILGQEGVLWVTGLGKMDPACTVQSVEIPSTVACNAVVKPTLTINGVSAIIDYAGITPGDPGLYQVNFRVLSTPSAVPSLQVQGILVSGDKQTSFNIIMSQQVVQ